MFCPKCGIENPDTGKFCRSCGIDLGNISDALMRKSAKLTYTVDPRKRGVSWEFAVTKISVGMAFLLVALILGFTGEFGAAKWWFWLLIPAFGSLASGVTQVVQLRKLEKMEAGFAPKSEQNTLSFAENRNALPPDQTDYNIPPNQSIFDTDNLVIQPSVTENTTRNLEMNSVTLQNTEEN